MLHHLQRSCRAALRPLAALARKALTPPPAPVEFDWRTITAGPAAGVAAMLPSPSPVTDEILAGAYERSVIDVVAALVDADDVCYDIGGHYGYYTLVLAKLAGRGAVHPFSGV